MNNLLMQMDLRESSYPKRMLVVSVEEEPLIHFPIEPQHLTWSAYVVDLPAHTRAQYECT